MSWLTTNTKLKKSLEFGYRSFGVHFSPHKLSGKDVCPNASPGCISSCLFSAGFGAYDKVKNARINKTKRFYNDKKGSLEELAKEIETQTRRTKNNGLIPTFRLNLTSDLAWETIKIGGKNLMEMFPDVHFYDYTKSLNRMLKFLTGQLPPNYHLTFSRSEKNQKECETVLACGGSVAAVFHKELPSEWMGKPVVEGLSNDLRFLDPKNVVVGLVALGKKAREDKSGFVIH